MLVRKKRTASDRVKPMNAKVGGREGLKRIDKCVYANPLSIGQYDHHN
jgi:hypothetical protein